MINLFNYNNKWIVSTRSNIEQIVDGLVIKLLKNCLMILLEFEL